MQQLMNQLMQQKNEYEAQLSSNALELKKLQDKIHEIEQKDREKESNMNHASPHIQQKPKEIKILDLNDIKNLEKISEIGSGGGGKVYKISMKITCALKEMNIKNKTIEDLRRFIAEYEIMNMLDHPNILKALGIFFGDNEEEEAPKIVLEYCPNNLESAIKEKSLNNVQIALCIYQIVEGMKYVHHQKIIHRDLKPSNILIDEHGTVKICDFGISKIMSGQEQQTMTASVGTMLYMAPEIMDNNNYDEKVDVYSFGILLYFALNNGDVSKIKLSDIFQHKKNSNSSKFQ